MVPHLSKSSDDEEIYVFNYLGSVSRVNYLRRCICETVEDVQVMRCVCKRTYARKFVCKRNYTCVGWRGVCVCMCVLYYFLLG